MGLPTNLFLNGLFTKNILCPRHEMAEGHIEVILSVCVCVCLFVFVYPAHNFDMHCYIMWHK